MYFLIRGEVEVVFMKDDNWICFNTYSEGYYFGEVDFLNDDKMHSDSTRAVTKSELLSLARENFENVMNHFEE